MTAWLGRVRRSGRSDRANDEGVGVGDGFKIKEFISYILRAGMARTEYAEEELPRLTYHAAHSIDSCHGQVDEAAIATARHAVSISRSAVPWALQY